MNRKEITLRLKALQIWFAINETEVDDETLEALGCAVKEIERVGKYRKKAKRWKQRYFDLWASALRDKEDEE